MDDEVLIGLAGLVVAGLAYFAGIQHGKHLAAAHAKHASDLQEKDHALQRELAETQRRAASIDRVVATYVSTVRTHLSSGIYAVADSGIATLDTHADALEALRRMQLEEGNDPLKGQRSELERVNLITFFRYVRERGINFAQTSVPTILERLKRDSIDPYAGVG